MGDYASHPILLQTEIALTSRIQSEKHPFEGEMGVLPSQLGVI